MSSKFALSVVLVTPHHYDTLRKTVQHLRAQTVSDQIELVIVAPSLAKLGFNETDRHGLGHVQVIETSTRQTLGFAKAAGVRAATAPIVAFAEDHCYPEPDWAEALIEAHRGPWAAVGPAIGNANPLGLVSWANLLIAYGHWLDPAKSGVIDDVPGHNSSYKRDILLQYGDELNSIMGREGSLHADLRKKGHQLYLAAEARACHLNPTRATAWVPLRFNAGRLFAAVRAKSGNWSPLRRALYIAGAPLIPLMRLPQLMRFLRASGRQSQLFPRILPILLFALIIHSVGEVAGYILGEGHTRERLANFEFDRMRQITRRDLIALSQA